MSRQLGVPFLGPIPLDAEVVMSGDSGEPIVASKPDSAASKAYGSIADRLTKQLGARFGEGGSTPAGARVISQVIESFALHPAIVDGSGLSRGDRSSPGQVVALLRKPDVIQVKVPVKYVGFDIPNEFVVGYGLDYAERFRNLPFVGTLAPHVYS